MQKKKQFIFKSLLDYSGKLIYFYKDFIVSSQINVAENKLFAIQIKVVNKTVVPETIEISIMIIVAKKLTPFVQRLENCIIMVLGKAFACRNIVYRILFSISCFTKNESFQLS
jgi:hypothetical protein